MIADILVAIAGILIFLFVFWKRLKEDYSSDIIFKTATSILAGTFLAWALSLRVYSSAFLWFAFIGAIGGLTFASYNFRVRFYETLEAFSVSILPWVSFVFLKNSVTNSSLVSFIAFLVTLVFIFVFYYLDIHYKNFTWYKSGKIGFSGLATLGLIFATRFALATTGITMISFLSRYEAILSGIAAVVCAGLVFNLGRQKK